MNKDFKQGIKISESFYDYQIPINELENYLELNKNILLINGLLEEEKKDETDKKKR